MVTNVTQKNKTLQQVIDYCKSKRKDCRIMYTRTTNHNHDDRMILCAGLRAYGHIIDYCTHLLGYSGSMPSEVPNQKRGCEMTIDELHDYCRYLLEHHNTYDWPGLGAVVTLSRSPASCSNAISGCPTKTVRESPTGVKTIGRTRNEQG